jgi:hypothetical protein
VATNVLPLNDAEARLRAAYAKGDKDALRLAARDYMTSKARFERQGRMSRDMTGLGANDGTGKGRQLLEGVGAGMQNVGLRAARMLTPESREGDLTSRINEQTHLDQQMSGLQKGGKFAGEMIATAPVGGLAGGAVRALPNALRAGLGAATQAPGAALRAGSYAAEGALGGGLVEDGGAGSGAVASTVLSPLLNRAGRLARGLGVGMRQTDEARILKDYGADLTPGQHNPGGMLDRIERAGAQSPLFGGGVKRAREQAADPVIPNLVSDIIERPRPRMGAGDQGTIRRASQRVDSRQANLYGSAHGNAARPMSRAEMRDTIRDTRASVARHVPPDQRQALTEARNAIRRINRSNTLGDVKSTISDLKKEARALRYSKEAKGTGRFAQARVLEDLAQGLERRAYKGRMRPNQVRMVERADRITGEYAPVERAIEAATKAGRDAPMGTELLAGIRKGTTRGQFNRGAGGRVREVADSLVDHQKDRSNNFVERNPILGNTLALLSMPAAAVASSAPVRAVAGGMTRPQQSLRRTLQGLEGRGFGRNPNSQASARVGRMLRESLTGLRAGAGPAYLTDEEEPQ